MNALRFAFGTLSIIPVRPPERVDRAVAGWAMMIAPFVGLVLAVPLWCLSELLDDEWSPLVLATVWVGGLAVLTRAMHLDGLADTADGLGSGKPADQALEIMRKSDVGPFGVATLVLVLMVQVAATTQLLLHPDGPAYVVLAVVLSRLILPWACLSDPARTDGLGALVAGAVTRLQVLLATVLPAAIVVLIGPEVLVGLIALVVGVAFLLWCVRRLGGITGDVLGGCVEVTFTAALLVLLFA